MEIVDARLGAGKGAPDSMDMAHQPTGFPLQYVYDYYPMHHPQICYEQDPYAAHFVHEPWEDRHADYEDQMHLHPDLTAGMTAGPSQQQTYLPPAQSTMLQDRDTPPEPEPYLELLTHFLLKKFRQQKLDVLNIIISDTVIVDARFLQVPLGTILQSNIPDGFKVDLSADHAWKFMNSDHRFPLLKPIDSGHSFGNFGPLLLEQINLPCIAGPSLLRIYFKTYQMTVAMEGRSKALHRIPPPSKRYPIEATESISTKTGPPSLPIQLSSGIHATQIFIIAAAHTSSWQSDTYVECNLFAGIAQK
ncbi:hypothetical protein EDC04DRAFT_2604296 [Pisolithus marmoratus]|nr:hypothetical protein EDC04DRAFT_2604296 [Pisolithus marmoratus]